MRNEARGLNPRNILKLATFMLLLGMGNYVPSGKGLPENERMTDWNEISTGFERFMGCPSPANAQVFLETLPKDRTIKELGKKADFLKLFADWRLAAFRDEIISGKRPAIEAAFRLLNVLERDRLRYVCIALGHTIRLYPEAFLELVHEYRNRFYIRNAGCPTGFVMESYERVGTAKLFELKMRLNALERIHLGAVEREKASCVSKLKEEILKQAALSPELGISNIPNRPLEGGASRLEEEMTVKASRAFIDYPSLENARRLRDLLPRTRQKIAFSPIDLEYDYWILENEAFAGNIYAAECVCRLLNASDGIAGIIYPTTLGTLIRVNPKVFLEVIKKYREQPDILATVLYYNSGFSFKESTRNCILKERLRILMAVDDPELLDVKNSCIRYIRKHLQTAPSEF